MFDNNNARCLPWMFACRERDQNDPSSLPNKFRWNWTFFSGHTSMALSSIFLALAPFSLQWTDTSDDPTNTQIAKVYGVYAFLLFCSDATNKLGAHLIDKVASDVTENSLIPWMYISSQPVDNRNSDRLISQLNDYKNTVKYFLLNINTLIWYRVIQVIIAIAVTFSVFDEKMYGGIFLGYVFFTMMTASIEHELVKKANAELGNQFDSNMGEQREYIINNDLIIAYNLYELAAKKVSELRKNIRIYEEKVSKVEDIFSIISHVLLRLAQFLVLYSTAKDVLDKNKNFDVSDLVNLMVYFQLLLEPIAQIRAICKEYSKKITKINGIKEVIESFRPDQTLTLPENGAAGLSIQLQNVSFSDILQRVNLTINSGEVVAIIGPTNAGKSTLVKIILGICGYQGNVLINNANITQISRSDLMKHVSIVPQETQLFNHKSLIDNIKIARQEESDRPIGWDLLDECKLSRIQEKGEGGQNIRPIRPATPTAHVKVDKLSGGEKQRVGIARAKIRISESKLLIFDEPTSSLDPQTSRMVWDQLSTISRDSGKTVLYVTHDQEIATKADKILVVHDKTVDVCTSASLTSNQTYRDMCSARDYSGFLWHASQPQSTSTQPATNSIFSSFF